MKKAYYIILNILLILFLIGCESDTNIENKKFVNDHISFTSIGTKATRSSESPSGDRDLQEVPDTVGVFLKKTDGTSEFIMENAIYRITNYKSDNFLATDGSVTTQKEGDPVPGGKQLFWYKTSHRAAYWDKKPGVTYDFFAYAPAVETNKKNKYYNIDDEKVIEFNIDEKLGVPVDFIYANKVNCEINQADSLHLPFRHMLSKMVFKLKNTTKNAITCYGVRYKINYPVATFNLETGKWKFTGTSTSVEVKRYAQYEIFSETEVELSELTTLLFPTHTDNLAPGSMSGNVIVEFYVCLNNKWYDMTNKLAAYDLQYTEGKLIELTFNCTLGYGSNHESNDKHWNIFVATFDSFEDGGSLNGTLK